MKLKSILLSLFSLCLALGFSATSVQAVDGWAGYKLIKKTTHVSIYVKVENRKSEGDRSHVWWRAVNHTDRWIDVSFKPVYYYHDGDSFTGYTSGRITPSNKASYLGTYNADVHSIRNIEIFEFETHLDTWRP